MPGWDQPGFDDPAGPGDVEDRRDSRCWSPSPTRASPRHQRSVRRRRPSPSRSRACTSSTWARTWSAGCGWRCSGSAGTTVTMRHAEMLNPDGTLYTDEPAHAPGHRPLHAARAAARRSTSRASPSTASATSRSTGYPGRRRRSDAVTGAWSSTPTRRPTARSSARTPLINQLQQQHLWGQRGNFLESPPTARSATSGWAGRATRRSSSAPPRSTCDVAALLHQVDARRRRRPVAEGGASPTSRPADRRMRRRARRPGATPA